MGKVDDLYPFYQANIHERRFAARFFRALPLALTIAIIGIVIFACFKSEMLLLWICAVLNVALWLWITTTSLFGIAGSYLVTSELAEKERVALGKKPASPNTRLSGDADSDGVMHLIVFPNYKEPEDVMAETLACLSEAEDSYQFHVVLAIESREGEEGREKAVRLQDKFSSNFADIAITIHPADLTQEHQDDSCDLEVPGKASNLKWAVGQSYDTLRKRSSDLVANVILTVADADCMFHPSYFSSVSKDFNELREKPGAQHQWCMWQAPQLSFRDHWRAPVCSRIWTYVSSMYEFGGVSGLHWGGHHMVFSGYSLPLKLAAAAQPWDGDVIAEDHHAYLKNFFYSAHNSAEQSLMNDSKFLFDDGCQPMLQVRPVFLPVKSSPVISDEGYWQTYVERWQQAKRHAQGLAELPYAMLVIWDALCTLPVRTYSFDLFYKMTRVLVRLLCMHVLPVCQGVSLAVISLYWLYRRGHLKMCPSHLTVYEAIDTNYGICWLGGAWTLIWPMMIPFVFVIIANYTFYSSSFLGPAWAKHRSTLWNKENGGGELSACYNFSWIAVDCAVFTTVMMIPYGLIACFLAMWNVCLNGNRFKYVVAAKATKESTNYGATDDSKPSEP